MKKLILYIRIIMLSTNAISTQESVQDMEGNVYLKKFF
jgi:hypothetical protein